MEEITPEWLENFSTSVYHPMEGLLADEDFRFLSRQPGFDLSLYRKLRRERLRIFRQYLNLSLRVRRTAPSWSPSSFGLKSDFQ